MDGSSLFVAPASFSFSSFVAPAHFSSCLLQIQLICFCLRFVSGPAPACSCFQHILGSIWVSYSLASFQLQLICSSSLSVAPAHFCAGSLQLVLVEAILAFDRVIEQSLS